MANVSQIEDKNGVVKDIVDKGLDEKTSQNSIASSDYVLLEDIDGAYHKIAKASFTEAVRSALGAVINSVAKGNDIAKVPVLDSNNDLGMGTLANLASVLGGDIREIIAFGSTPLSITRDIGDWSGNATEIVDFNFKKNGVTSTAVSLTANKDYKELFAVSSASAAFGVIRDIGDYSSNVPVCLDFYFRTTSGDIKVGNFLVNKNNGELYWQNEVTGNSTKLA